MDKFDCLLLGILETTKRKIMARLNLDDGKDPSEEQLELFMRYMDLMDDEGFDIKYAQKYLG